MARSCETEISFGFRWVGKRSRSLEKQFPLTYSECNIGMILDVWIGHVGSLALCLRLLLLFSFGKGDFSGLYKRGGKNNAFTVTVLQIHNSSQSITRKDTLRDSKSI